MILLIVGVFCLLYGLTFMVAAGMKNWRWFLGLFLLIAGVCCLLETFGFHVSLKLVG